MCASVLPATASRVDTVPAQQSFKKARQQKTPWWLYALFLFVSLSLSLTFFMLHWRGGWGGKGEKVRGNKQENAEGIRSLIQLQHLEKRNTSSFYNTLKLQRAVTLRSGQPLLSVCTAVLSLSLYNLHSRNTLPFLVYVMRQFLLCAYLGDKGNGSQNEAEGRGFFQTLLTVTTNLNYLNK